MWWRVNAQNFHSKCAVTDVCSEWQWRSYSIFSMVCWHVSPVCSHFVTLCSWFVYFFVVCLSNCFKLFAALRLFFWSFSLAFFCGHSVFLCQFGSPRSHYVSFFVIYSPCSKYLSLYSNYVSRCICFTGFRNANRSILRNGVVRRLVAR